MGHSYQKMGQKRHFSLLSWGKMQYLEYSQGKKQQVSFVYAQFEQSCWNLQARFVSIAGAFDCR